MVGNPQCGEVTGWLMVLGRSARQSSSSLSGCCTGTVGDNAVEVDGLGTV